MGKLRTEPKQKSFLTQNEYDEIFGVLQEAAKAADNHHVYWDLDDTERPSNTKKAFLYVARKEGLDVIVRQVRGAKSLAFYFKRGRNNNSSRMSSSESNARILRCLQNATQPLKKNQIIKETGISASTWNIRIKDLLQEGSVARQGDRRDTTYTLVNK